MGMIYYYIAVIGKQPIYIFVYIYVSCVINVNIMSKVRSALNHPLPDHIIGSGD